MHITLQCHHAVAVRLYERLCCIAICQVLQQATVHGCESARPVALQACMTCLLKENSCLAQQPFSSFAHSAEQCPEQQRGCDSECLLWLYTSWQVCAQVEVPCSAMSWALVRLLGSPLTPTPQGRSPEHVLSLQDCLAGPCPYYGGSLLSHPSGCASVC